MVATMESFAPGVRLQACNQPCLQRFASLLLFLFRAFFCGVALLQLGKGSFLLCGLTR